MSQQIYLDDCACAKELVRLLEAAGHQVSTPAQAGLTGREDEAHFEHAAANALVLLTKNPSDFDALHQANPDHAGVLAIYQDNDPDRDMSHAEIVRSIANLASAGVEIKGNFHVLNAWRY